MGYNFSRVTFCADSEYRTLDSEKFLIFAIFYIRFVTSEKKIFLFFFFVLWDVGESDEMSHLPKCLSRNVVSGVVSPF